MGSSRSSAKTRSTMGCAIVDFPVLAGPESGDFSKTLQASSDSCSDSGPVSTVTTIQDDRIGVDIRLLVRHLDRFLNERVVEVSGSLRIQL